MKEEVPMQYDHRIAKDLIYNYSEEDCKKICHYIQDEICYVFELQEMNEGESMKSRYDIETSPYIMTDRYNEVSYDRFHKSNIHKENYKDLKPLEILVSEAIDKYKIKKINRMVNL